MLKNKTKQESLLSLLSLLSSCPLPLGTETLPCFPQCAVGHLSPLQYPPMSRVIGLALSCPISLSLLEACGEMAQLAGVHELLSASQQRAFSQIGQRLPSEQREWGQ